MFKWRDQDGRDVEGWVHLRASGRTIDVLEVEARQARLRWLRLNNTSGGMMKLEPADRRLGGRAKRGWKRTMKSVSVRGDDQMVWIACMRLCRSGEKFNQPLFPTADTVDSSIPRPTCVRAEAWKILFPLRLPYCARRACIRGRAGMGSARSREPHTLPATLMCHSCI